MTPGLGLNRTLQPRQLLRRVYVGRLVVSASIYLAAIFAWGDIATTDTLAASLLITVATAFTAGSFAWSEIQRRALGRTFLVLQSVMDLAVVTTIVHLTGGATSQFAALYILVIAIAALLQSTGTSLLVAALGCLSYFGEVLLWSRSSPGLETWLQLVVFALVALSCGYLGARLRDERTGAVELAAELANARLQATDILRNIRSGVITVDARGVLRYANPAASALLSLSLDNDLGKPILERLGAASPVLARALARAAVHGARTPRAEGMVESGGRSFPIGLHTTVTIENATATTEGGGTATAIFQDISDQKRLDDLHMRAERLEAVAELSASLAHEIKNPLASIRSACEQLGRSQRATDDEQVLSTLIVRESDRLSRLLSEFLDFARVRVTRIGPVNMSVLARDAATLVGAHPDRGEDVVIETRVPEEPVIVEGDEDLLHRAVFNLTLNAVQAMRGEANNGKHESGSVRVELARLTQTDAPAGISFDRGGIAVRVSDSGPGIPDEIRDRLFDPFFTTRPGGSGLGLSVVHRAIEAHRGFVFLDSDTEGGGTRVTVLLPNHQTEAGDAL
ncbi:MAG: two-component system sensor histidine kinase NtrB [Gemmatimonadota bacterium]